MSEVHRFAPALPSESPKEDLKMTDVAERLEGE